MLPLQAEKMNDNELPMGSKVWVYQSTRKLEPHETIHIISAINAFVYDWTSHKAGVRGSGEFLYNRFVVLMADEESVKVGGCSIDSSVHFIKSLERKYDTGFFDRLNIAYKKGDEVYSCPQEEFEQLTRKGIVNDETIVFNNLVQNKQEFLTKWEVPFKDSWHKTLFLTHTSFNSVL